MMCKKESAPTGQAKGANVEKTSPIVPQSDWERGCWAFPALFALGAIVMLVIGGR